MGRPKPTTTELKRQLVVQLDRARAELAHESRLAKVEWNPAAMMRRSVEKPRLAWIIGGAVAGFIALRMLMPTKFKSDNFAGSDTKRGFRGLFGKLLTNFARRAAMNYASTHAKDFLQTYLESLLKRQGPDSSSHVASR